MCNCLIKLKCFVTISILFASMKWCSLQKLWENLLLISWFASHFRDILYIFLLVFMVLLVFVFLTVSHFQPGILYRGKDMILLLESLITMWRELLGQPLFLTPIFDILGNIWQFQMVYVTELFTPLELYSTDL